MTLRELGMMLLVAMLWAASFLFIRIAVPVIGPFVLTTLRVVLAGGTLLVYAWSTKRLRVFRPAWWKTYLFLGALNAAIPFVLIALAEVS